MQPAWCIHRRLPPTFQSSPGQKAGCNRPGVYTDACHLRFNPHPARRPGATDCVQGRLGLGGRGVNQAVRRVLFQSSPGQKAGCNSSVIIMPPPPPCFNPHPARRPGATGTKGSRGVVMTQVSILTRPEGRVQHGMMPPLRTPFSSFNPHPARRPGATLRILRCRLQRSCCFNPHPARRPGATRCQPRVRRNGLAGFNPHPARRPGATIVAPCIICSWQFCFNPHPARRPGATDGNRRASVRRHNGFQSSPGQKAGCNRKGSKSGWCGKSGFNPHPARRPGATVRRMWTISSGS